MRIGRHQTHRSCRWLRRVRAGVLLEVVLALVLFTLAAAIVTGAFNASLTSVERLRFRAHASDLAVSTLSEIQLGIRPLADSGPETFAAPFTNWTWQITTTPEGEWLDETPPMRVEVIIRHTESQAVHRLCQMVEPPLEAAPNVLP
jgi:hypothetical protein